MDERFKEREMRQQFDSLSIAGNAGGRSLILLSGRVGSSWNGGEAKLMKCNKRGLAGSSRFAPWELWRGAGH